MLLNKRSGFTAERMAYIALLTALQVVLGNVVQIHMVSKQFNLGFLPIAIAGAAFGPVEALIVGALGDVIGVICFPVGAYFPGYTLTNVLVGLLYGFLLYERRPDFLRGVIAVTLASVVYLFLNSYWLSITYTRNTYWGWVGSRFWTYLIEIPLQSTVLYFSLKLFERVKIPALAAIWKQREDAGKQ